MKSFLLAWLLFKRDWRAGEMRILLFAVVTAVTCLSSIGLFTDRVSRAIETQTAALFGGDLVVESDQPIKPAWREHAQKLQLRDSVTLSFLSMVEANGQFQLAAIKAVDQHYPLIGEFRRPSRDSVWLSPRLVSGLAIKNNTKIKVGVASFTAAPFIQVEPDATNEWSLFAPRLMMSLADVEKTKIIQPGSRLNYRWALTGSSAHLEELRAFLLAESPGLRILSAAKDQPTLSNILTRSSDYFQLASLVSIALTAVACAIAIRRYTERHYRYVALLRTFGMEQPDILRVYLWNVLGFGLMAAIIGGILGLAGQWLLDHVFKNLISIPLPAISFWPIGYAVILVLITLMGVGLPHLLRLKNVPTLHILRARVLPAERATAYWYLVTLLMLLLIGYFTVQNLTVLGYFVASVLCVVALLLVAGWLMLAGLQRVRSQLNSAWRFGLANVHRYRTNSLVLLVGFGFCIMVLLLMLHLQNGLLQDWRQSLPVGTPNYFVVNIPAESVKELENFLAAKQVKTAGFYPVVRGRLTTLNGKPFKEAIPESARADESLQRSLNLTWRGTLPEKNTLLAGQWWNQKEWGLPVVSVEHRFAERLHLKMHDVIGVTVNDQIVTAKIVNIRDVNWVSFRPTFYMIYPPKILQNFPATYLTSFYLSKQQNILLTDLVQKFPSVSVIDVADITSRLQSLMNNVTQAIFFILGFVFIASISVLMAGVQANITDRMQASMILRALGASQKQLTIIMLNEFMLIGAIAGLIAAIGAAITSIYISSHVFELADRSVWQLFLLGPLVGVVVVTGTGLLASRKILRQNAAEILRTFEG